MKNLTIAGKKFTSRLFLGTGKFSSNELMSQAIKASQTQMVTVAMKRLDFNNKQDDMLLHIKHPGIQLLPNTSGVRNAKEAVFAAQLARDAFETNWLKLEIHPDPRYLLPDPVETLKATEELAKLGFIVLPYIQADPVLCKRLEEAGSATVMPLGAPIGTNKGLKTRDLLEIIIEQSKIRCTVSRRRSSRNGSRCRFGQHRDCRRRRSGCYGKRFPHGCRMWPNGLRSAISRPSEYRRSHQPINRFLNVIRNL